MESKIMNHIEFKFTRVAYPSNEKLFCYFGTTNPSTHVPQVGDWVGMFRVGWKGLKEHHVRKFVSVENIEISKKVNLDYTHVVFEQTELPKERETYYQFVYVTKNDIVRGVSRPFQIELENVELKDELKELKKSMWETLEERESWSEREQREMLKERTEEKLRRREEERREREREHRERVRKPDSVKLVEKLESELLGDKLKLSEESIVGKLIQRYLASVRSKKDEDFSKRFEELFVENNKLSSSLRSRINEVADLQKECEELKIENQELGAKVAHGDRKQRLLERELEREREVIRKRLEEREQVLPSLYERNGKQSLEKVVSELDEAKVLLKEENERLRDELRRLSVLYQTESANHSSLKHKLLKIDETWGKRQVSELMESEYEVKALKKLVDELRSENEALKARIRYDSEYVRPETTTTSKTTIIKEKSSLPRVSSQPEYMSLIETKPYGPQETYPSISITTSPLPEITTSKSSMTIGSKLSSLPISRESRESREQLSESSLLTDVFIGKFEEQLKKKSIEEHLKSKLEKLKLIELNLKELKELKENPVEKTVDIILNGKHSSESKVTPPSYLVYQTTQMSNDDIQKQLKRQPQKYSFQQYEEQAKQNLREQMLTSQYNTICPVCGIAVSKELNQTEFELHVNSHFTD